MTIAIVDEPTESNWRTVYATVKDREGNGIEVSATHYKDGDTDGNEVVIIWNPNDGFLGGILLSKLEGSKLTERTLTNYFAQFQED